MMTTTVKVVEWRNEFPNPQIGGIVILKDVDDRHIFNVAMQRAFDFAKSKFGYGEVKIESWFESNGLDVIIDIVNSETEECIARVLTTTEVETAESVLHRRVTDLRLQGHVDADFVESVEDLISELTDLRGGA